MVLIKQYRIQVNILSVVSDNVVCKYFLQNICHQEHQNNGFWRFTKKTNKICTFEILNYEEN